MICYDRILLSTWSTAEFIWGSGNYIYLLGDNFSQTILIALMMEDDAGSSCAQCQPMGCIKYQLVDRKG